MYRSSEKLMVHTKFQQMDAMKKNWEKQLSKTQPSSKMLNEYSMAVCLLMDDTFHTTAPNRYFRAIIRSQNVISATMDLQLAAKHRVKPQTL